MNLVYVIDHLGSAGAQRQVTELAVGLRTLHDCRVTLLTYHEADFFRDRLDEVGIPIVRFPKRMRIDPTLPWRIRRWLMGQSVDVVHAFLLAPALWSLLSVRSMPKHRRPAFIAAELSSRIAMSTGLSILQRLVYRSSDAVTSNARPVAEQIHTKLGVPRDRITYLPNPIDLDAWDRAARERCPLSLEQGRFHIALVGRFEPVKNHALLLEALERIGPEALKDWKVWFVGASTGGTSFVSEIQAAIRNKHLENIVEVVPPLREIPALMRRLDAVVLPSKLEGFPNVVLEAMASRLPCVAARVGDVPNMLVDRQSGLLVEPESAGALAEALLALRRLPAADRRRMGARARETVESRYQTEVVTAAYARLYRALAAEQPE